MNSVGVLELKVPKETSEGLAGKKKKTPKNTLKIDVKKTPCSRDLKGNIQEVLRY